MTNGSRDCLSGTQRITAAKLVRNFAKVQALAQDRPCVITNHSRETHVLLSIKEYRSLLEKPETIEADPLIEIGRMTNEAMIIFDEERRVLHANYIATAMLRMSDGELNGALLGEIPEIRDIIVGIMVRRTCISNEPTSTEAVSPFSKNAWIRVRTFPWRTQNLLLIQDITDQISSRRLANIKASIIDAMRVHGGIGYARISLRGTIDQVDGSFPLMLGLPAERLVGSPMENLLEISGRSAFRDALEDVLRGDESKRLSVHLITNSGVIEEVVVVMVQLNGPYGVEGVVVLITK